MGENRSLRQRAEDIFAHHAAGLAAQTRQLFRAHRARDTEALNIDLLYFDDYMLKVLLRLSSKHDSAWDNSSRPLDFSSYRWFDGWNAEPEFLATGHLRLRGEVYWRIGREHGAGYYDPLDFEIELCPRSGVFRKYVFRFGDSRPLTAKTRGSVSPGVPVGEWAYVFERDGAGPDVAAE